MDKAQALLDAHVAYTIKRLQGDALQEEVERLVDNVLLDASKLKLKEVVTTKSVQKTALKYAVDLQLGGAMPALVGDIARALYDHKVHGQTTLAELVPDRMFEEFLDKFLELETLRESLVSLTVTNPLFGQMISELLYSSLEDYAQQGTKAASKVPGAKSAMRLGKAMMNRAKPELGEMLEENLRVYVKKSTAASLKASEKFLLDAIESDEFREVVLDLWADNKHHTVATVRDYAGAIDVEEIFVIGYEYWQHLRQTKIYAELISGGIKTFFDCYGNHRLSELLDDIGVSREMIIEDAMLFAPKIVAALDKKNLLEPAVRRQFEGFYLSAEAQDILRA